MWPIVLAFGTVGLFIALASKGASAARLKAPEPGPAVGPTPEKSRLPVTPVTPPAPIVKVTPPKPPPSCTPADEKFIKDVLAAARNGQASLDMIRKAHAVAVRCFPVTAKTLELKLKQLLEASRAKAVPDPAKQLAAVVRAADAPASPIPNDPKTGKSLWFMDTRGGVLMAIPRFRPVLNLFKKLQSLLGVKQDGRIGPGTLRAFQDKMRSRGFTRFPDTQAKLAANVAKYITVLSQGLQQNQVGAHGGRARSPFPRC